MDRRREPRLGSKRYTSLDLLGTWIWTEKCLISGSKSLESWLLAVIFGEMVVLDRAVRLFTSGTDRRARM